MIRLSTAFITPLAVALGVASSGWLTQPAYAQTAAPAAKPAPAVPTKKAAAGPVIRRSVAADVITSTAPPKPTEPILTRDQLRACMTEKPKNDAAAKQIVADQAQFQKDYEQIKADQAVVTQENAANKALSLQIAKERNDLLLAVNEPAPAASAASAAASTPDTTATIALKAAAAAAASKAQMARANAVDDKITAFNASQQGIRDRAKAVDDRVPAINAQSKALNARVEAQQTTTDEWNKRCSAKLFDELDEIAVKKELAAPKP